MIRPSFSTQLTILWGLAAGICAVLVALAAFVAASMYSQQTVEAQERARAFCNAVATRYAHSLVLPGNQPRSTNIDLMHAVLDTVLAQAPGIEGGFWQAPGGQPAQSAGFLAYAFPTYEGSGIKRDIPEAETPLILRTLGRSAAAHATVADAVTNGTDGVVAAACPVGLSSSLYAWTLTRTRPPFGLQEQRLIVALAAALAVLLAVALALALMLRRWKRDLASLEQALSMRPARMGVAAALPRVGEPELDPIVDAFNRYLQRESELQQETGELHVKLAREERFAALGKMAAQLAHEIRNPAGAMRLKAENALAGDSDRQRAALRFMLAQLERIESQIASLLMLTRAVSTEAGEVRVCEWLTGVVETHRENAHQLGVTLVLARGGHPNAGWPAARFDAAQLQRALDNLLQNALRHTPAGGTVEVCTTRQERPSGARLRIAVCDEGPGVPVEHRERIFEPFVTGRHNGSGLGLAVVQEVAAAHGGRAWVEASERGASFVIEIPWRPSL